MLRVLAAITESLIPVRTNQTTARNRGNLSTFGTGHISPLPLLAFRPNRETLVGGGQI